uniref:hypothetical protein n=1 Tax=Tessaracoccus bendigoensis TaxID=72764 RepID=UPI0015881AD8|nr:hypothetical protein [Tessaracoccus bendigoensis]
MRQTLFQRTDRCLRHAKAIYCPIAAASPVGVVRGTLAEVRDTLRQPVNVK